MKRNSFVIVFLCSFYFSPCQDRDWQQIRIDSILTVSLPRNVTSFDTAFLKNGKSFNTRVFKASTEYSHIGVTVTQTDLNVNPYDYASTRETYEGVKYGLSKNATSQGFYVDIKDTLVNTVKGFVASFYADSSRRTLSRVVCLFCVNTLTYSVVAAPAEDKVAECRTDLMKLLRSIRFSKKQILKNAPAADSLSSSFSEGQKLGELLGPILLVAGLVIFFVYKSRKRK
ncbi:MAG TPA: hypothetical protein PLZ45_08135 [Ferruginibacter sp.]|nr:hypothetical protein [Ferruginibacter sp.]